MGWAIEVTLGGKYNTKIFPSSDVNMLILGCDGALFKRNKAFGSISFFSRKLCTSGTKCCKNQSLKIQSGLLLQFLFIFNNSYCTFIGLEWSLCMTLEKKILS
jgi:hypothetical protein